MAPPQWLFTLLGFLAVLVVFVVVPYSLALGGVFRSRHHVRCPETGTDELVGIGLARQTVHSFLPVCDPTKLCACTRWPARRRCDQACTRQI